MVAGTVAGTVSSVVLWVVVLGAVILSVRPRPGSDARTITESAQKYSRRISVVALAAVIWLPGLISPEQVSGTRGLGWGEDPGWSAAVLQLGAPTALALVILAAGELTWPKPQGAVRTAALGHRSVRTLLPRYPLAVAVIILALDLLLMGAALALAPESGDRARFLAGWLPWLLVTGAGTVGVLKLIAARPTVPGTSPDVDRQLRQASAFRVLRVSGGIFLSLLVAAGNYLYSIPAPPLSEATARFLATMSFPFALAAFACGVALLHRAPKVAVTDAPASEPEDPMRPGEASPLVVRSLTAAMGFTIGGPVLAAGAVTALFLTVGGQPGLSLLIVAGAAWAALGWLMLIEVWTARGTRTAWRGLSAAPGPGADSRNDQDPVDPTGLRAPAWLGWTAGAAAVLALLIQVATAALGPAVDEAAASAGLLALTDGTAFLPPEGSPAPFFNPLTGLAAGLILLLLPAAAGASMFVRRRPAFPASDAPADLRLRRVAQFRMARTAAAAALAAVGVPLLGLYTSHPWIRISVAGTRWPPPLDWLAPALSQITAGAWLWCLLAILIAVRPNGPSLFPDPPAPGRAVPHVVPDALEAQAGSADPDGPGKRP